MQSRFRRHFRKLIIALVLLLAAGWALPSILNANRYRARLATGLEQTLHRRVAFGEVAFHLLPRPGFSIENAVIAEDPAFGFEPFARVDRIDCDLKWRSLVESRLEFSRLNLDTPSINLVRNAEGKWNVTDLLQKSGARALGKASGGAGGAKGGLDVEVENARIDFSAGANKEPFAITGVEGTLALDRSTGRLTYHFRGDPVRTDLALPTPGPVELDGTWTASGNLDAELLAKNSLLYDWVPLLTGQNPEVYGVLDAQARLTGSLDLLKVAGQASLSQLHRWSELPPTNSVPLTINYRGQIDRRGGEVLLDSVDASFADSHLHLRGLLKNILSPPNLDVVVAIERSRVEDFMELASLLSGRSLAFAISGRVDGLLDVRGPWSRKQYSGFVSAQDVHVMTRRGSYPVSEIDLRINREGVRLAPVRLAVAPRVELVAEGKLAPISSFADRARLGWFIGGSKARSSGFYQLTLSGKSIPLHNLLNFGKEVGAFSFSGLDAQGLASVNMILKGSAWPLARPEVQGRADLRSARLLIPGLTEPLNLPRASIKVTDGRIIASPVIAVIGTSIFSGKIEHAGPRTNAWTFSLQANNLNLEQGALWFDVLGHRQPTPLLERLPGLSSLLARRTAASNLLADVHAQGEFITPAVMYRGLKLANFSAAVEISDRVVRLRRAKFTVGGGRGQGDLTVDMRLAPARLNLDASLTNASLALLAPRLPAQLQKIRGSYSGTAQFETRGLDREEMAEDLKGQGSLTLSSVGFGGFDPLGALVRKAGRGALEPPRAEAGFRACRVSFRVGDRRIWFREFPVSISGAKLDLAGNFNFGGELSLGVNADLSRVSRRWLGFGPDGLNAGRQFALHLAGPLAKLVVAPQMAAARVNP